MTPGFPYQQPHFGGSQNVSWQARKALSSNSAQSQSGVQQQYFQHFYSAAAQQLANTAPLSIQNIIFHTESPYKPLKTEGIRLGEILAFRGWMVTPQGFLRSMSANAVWAPGEPMEGKTKSTSEHNGVYAYKTAKDFLTNHAEALHVYGRVALWGDIIEHELGYRAQFAKIISLDRYLTRRAPYKIPIKELRQKYCPEAA